MAGFRLTTKVQVSGWRFLLRRVEHAIVRRDTRMFDDPLQFYSRAVSLGIVIAVLVCLGAALLAYFKPLGKRGGDNLLVDRTTNQLYVVMPGTNLLHPVYNLTSARLVLGNRAPRTRSSPTSSNRMPKGQPIGIPGAPYATPVATVRRVDVDVVRHGHQAGKRCADGGYVGASCCRSSPTARSGRCGPTRVCWCPSRTRTGWSPRTGRHAIDLADRAVTSAVGIPVTAKATPISEGLFNALPNAGPWQLPPGSGRGRAEYRWPAAESGDRIGVPDRDRFG